jgi:hypothetical protein
MINAFKFWLLNELVTKSASSSAKQHNNQKPTIYFMKEKSTWKFGFSNKELQPKKDEVTEKVGNYIMKRLFVFFAQCCQAD